MKIEAVILDWAGTTVDYGCFSPVEAFIQAFASQGIDVTVEEVREPMGMLKRDHIKAMLEMPRISSLFKKQKCRVYNDEDVNQLMDVFTEKLMNYLSKGTELKPGTLKVFETLKSKGIKIGSTTGYTQAMLAPVAKSAKEQGYTPDIVITPENVNGFGRPYPFMIFENLKRMGVKDVRNVIKIGDTVADIQEAKNAGVKAFAVIEGSSVIGMSEIEWKSLPPDEKSEKSLMVRRHFVDAGADVVLQNLQEIKAYIQ